MSGYILKIVAVVLFSIIIDILMPAGKMEKIVKTGLSFIVVFVIVSPIPNLILKMKNISTSENGQLIDMEYVKKINLKKIDNLEERIENELKSYGIENIEIELMCDLSKTEITYLFANVDARSVVLTDKAKGIDLNEKIKEVVVKFIDIKKENVLVYE